MNHAHPCTTTQSIAEYDHRIHACEQWSQKIFWAKKTPGDFLSQKRWGATWQDSRLDVHSIGIPAGKQLRLSPFYILQMAFTPKLHGILRKVLIGMHPQVVHGSRSEPDMLLGGFIALRLETDIWLLFTSFQDYQGCWRSIFWTNFRGTQIKKNVWKLPVLWDCVFPRKSNFPLLAEIPPTIDTGSGIPTLCEPALQELVNRPVSCVATSSLDDRSFLWWMELLGKNNSWKPKDHVFLFTLLRTTTKKTTTTANTIGSRIIFC